MKLLLLSSEFPPGPGGIGTHAYQLARGLSERGWQVKALVAQDFASGGEVAAFNQSQPFAVESFAKIPLAPLKAVQRFAALRRTMRTFRPELVLVTGERAVWVAGAALGSTTTPWAAVGHGSEFNVVPRWERSLVTSSFNRASAIVAVSNFTLKLIHDCGIRPRRSCVITNGADESLFRKLPAGEAAEFRQKYGLGNDPLLLTVGNVTERKGQEVIIRAMPAILRRHPRAQYAMVGLPTLQAQLSSLARDLGVAQNLHFLGRLPSQDLVQALNAADVFLMTSRRTASGDCEGFGIAVIEAALCGRTAIVSSGSGLTEAIVDEHTGLSVPEGESGPVADAVCRLLEDGDLRRRLETAAESRARLDFTWSRVVAKYDAFFHELLHSADAPAHPGQQMPS